MFFKYGLFLLTNELLLLVIVTCGQLLAWFWHIRGTYSAISRVAMLCALVSASSASAERMFSYLKTMFPDQRDSALEDIVATSVMYRANFNYRNNEDKRCNRRK